MSSRMRLALLVLAAIVIAMTAYWLLQDDIDECLDSGGCWDASRHMCEFQDQSRCKPLGPLR